MNIFNTRLALYLIYATENLFKIRFSHRESLLQICYVAKDGTELLIFLSLPPKHWDSWQVYTTLSGLIENLCVISYYTVQFYFLLHKICIIENTIFYKIYIITYKLYTVYLNMSSFFRRIFIYIATMP